MARKILVVDDDIVNRQMLCNLLSAEYDVVEADNGREALEYIHRNHKMLSAVALDIMMPELDGFEVLRQVRESPLLSHLPVIVITSSGDEVTRVKALSLGANDYITKPYNKDIIRHCLRNNIALRETASIVNAIQRDKLTGIYNREFFFEKADSLINEDGPGAYILSCFDVDNFKLVNEQYGTAEGDRILKHIGTALKDCFDRLGGICGRISGDNFVALFANDQETIRQVDEALKTTYLPKNAPSYLYISVGRCVAGDLTLPASSIYDRAFIAKQSVKGRYDRHVAYFDDSMLEELLRSQDIAGGMTAALEQHQFEVWFQPQYNHSTGALVGAEALVRWRHPEKGLIGPGDFIPVFERNGFIYELDKYVWDETCHCLRRWMDSGKNPLPVSVNISRYDIFREDLTDVLTGLLKKYELPVELLRIEITESAFSKSIDQITAVAKQLIDLGFTIEIDDFGSGYSSLNTLKDVPAQILKLDMHLLEMSENSRRGGNILESVVRMAKWLGMTVIAEGVETKAQADFLESVGCVFIQGYYYARPMPCAEYEALSEKAVRENSTKPIETVESLSADEFWNPESLDTLIFSSYVGGACVVEFSDTRCELVRVNQRYIEVIRSELTTQQILGLDPMSTYTPEDGAALRAQVESAAVTGEEFRGEIWKTFLHDTPVHRECLRYVGRVIAKTKQSKIVYLLVDNITAQKRADEQLRFLNEVSHGVLAQLNVSAGIDSMLHRLLEFFRSSRSYIFEFDNDNGIAKNTYEICAEGVAHNKAELQSLPLETLSSWLERFHRLGYVNIDSVEALPSDRPDKAVLQRFGISSLVAVPLMRDGDIIGFVGVDDTDRNHSELERLVALGDYLSVMLTRRDYESMLAKSNELLEQMMQDMPGGYAKMRILPDISLKPVFINNEFCRLCGMTHQQALELYGDSAFTGVHPDDIDSGRKAIEKALVDRQTISLRVRLPHRNGGYVLMQAFYRVTEDPDGSLYLNGYYSDATELDKLETQRSELLNNLPCGAGLFEYDFKDLRVIHLNDRCWELMGRSKDNDFKGSALQMIHPEDHPQAKAEFLAAIADNRLYEHDLRILSENGNYRNFHCVDRFVARGDGKYTVYSIYTPISDEALNYRQMLPVLLSAIMESTSDMAFAKDRDLRYICASRAFAKLCGHETEADIIGKTDAELFSPELAEKYRQDDETLLQSGEPIIDMLELIPSTDGVTHYSSTSKYILRDANGGIIGLYGAGRDVTATRDAFDKLRLLTDSIPGGLATFEISPDGAQLVYANEGFFRFSGYTRDEYIALSLADPFCWIFDEDKPSAIESVLRLLDGSCTISSGNYRSPTKDGGYRWYSLTGSIAEKRGDTFIVDAVKYDITEQKLAESEARDAAAKLRVLTDNLPGGIATYNVSRGHITITYFNDGFCELFGVTREEYTALSSADLFGRVHKDDVQSLRAQVDSLINNGTSINDIYRVRAKDGSYKWISYKASITDRQGEELTVAALVLDVSEQYAATEKLRISEEENRLALRHSGNIISRMDIRSKTATIAPETAERFSLPQLIEDIPGSVVGSGLVSPDTADVFLSLYQDILDGKESGQAEFQVKMPSGWRWIEAHFSTAYDSDSVPIFAVISFFDVTERVEKEAIVRKWQQSLQERDSASYSLFRSNISKDSRYDSREGQLIGFDSGGENTGFSDGATAYANACVYEEDRAKYLAIANASILLANYYRGKRYEELEYREKLPGGEMRWLRLTVELVELPSSKDIAAYLLYEDINDAKNEQLQTLQRAETDPLTGVLNRKTFIDKMETLISQREENTQYALFMLDLDGFKQINDNFGHDVGDETLIEVGQKLRSLVRSRDLVGRLGGDEFIIFLSDLQDEAPIAPKAKQICDLLRKTFSLEVEMSASIGIAIGPRDGEGFAELYHKTDLALYQVKEHGRNNFMFYSEGLCAGPAADHGTACVPAGQTAPSPLAPAEEQKRRMLIVEDSLLNQKFLTNIFEDEFTIDTAGEGNTALIRLRRYGSSISVVLLDLIMPGMDGFTVLEKMRESPELESIPVIVVSGMNERETSLKAIAHGASDYITKPVDPALIKLRVASAISKAENERLRAQNRFLALQSDATARYRAMVECEGTIFAECSSSGGFVYDSKLSERLAGSFNDRSLWEILREDGVASEKDIEALRALVLDAFDRHARPEGIPVTLVTSDAGAQPFRARALRRSEDSVSSDRVIICFTRQA